MNKNFLKRGLTINKIIGLVLGTIGLLLIFSAIPVKFLFFIIGISLLVMSALLLSIK